jgi:cobaltochelatase CobN
MHLLNTSTATLDEQTEPVDLRQPPAPMAVLSFTDSDLAGLAAAWEAERDVVPALRLVPLRELRHPMSVDLWLERTASGARIIVLRLLGGLDWWRYGAERLAEFCRARGIALAVLPGEDRADPRLPPLSTLPAEDCAALLAGFRAGGVAPLRGVLRRMACHAGVMLAVVEAPSLPLAGYAGPRPDAAETRPIVPIIFYRSMQVAEDAAPVAALAEALASGGAVPVPIFVASLKEPQSVAFLRAELPRLNPALIVACTAFAEGQDQPVLAACGVPVLQAVMATTARRAWAEGTRGLGAADLAMHVVLPELDGRVLGGAIGFKDAAPSDAALGFTRQINRAEPDRVAQLAARVQALLRLGATPPAERRIAILLPDYPGAGGRTGYAVGLDVPASVLALLEDLRGAGYAVGDPPGTPRALLEALATPSAAWPVADYDVRPGHAAIEAAWDPPAQDCDVTEGAFRFRAIACGNILLAVAPDRGRAQDRRATYHDPALPPRHALHAFGLWLRAVRDVHAVVHMGAHGTLEWLPGKAVALTAACFPEAVLGALPVVYPFLVSNPGEAAQAKRRIAAVTLGHLPPPLTTPGLAPELHDLDRLLDEFAAADGLDRRRRERLAQLIQQAAESVPTLPALPPEAEDRLRALDAWMCDVKELAIQDGQHVYGRAAPGAMAERSACAASERVGLLAALDARHVRPGPAGAPARGRRDVMPTGRNLTASDPRGLPTPTAMELGRLAAAEALRLYAQEHGEMPRRLVLDLWGSATLRTGGEEIAQGLALLGCVPLWEGATGRVTGVEVQPPAVLGRARVDVTWRISGLFRDLFPAQIALLDAATRAVAARDETAEENPLAEARRADLPLARIFGAPPGAYGAGVEDALAAGDWTAREELGRAYLAGATHRYGGAGGEASPDAEGFAARVAAADALLHPGDDPGRDLLQGGADVAHLGGFAAAAAMLGATPMLITLDTSDPARPRARPLDAALRRLVMGRAVDPRFIAGQMRHGPRGASELAETVDRLVAFAETTGAVDSALLDRVHAAYVQDAAVRDFLRHENPAAARAIALRFEAALRRGLWHPRGNAIAADLALLREPA